ncbi:MAG: M4 family metallopeptidase [Cyclobacteriaceae bacterium]|nr:M4 family metallopeptidase [Cyclobacteriaceae bacterium]
MFSRILLFILIGCFASGPGMAQQSLRTNANTAFVVDKGSDRLYYASRHEPPRAIEFKARTVTASSFVTNINRYLNIPAEFTFTEAESNTDKLGMHHRLLQQNYRGIPLEGMGYRIHEKGGFMTSANGKAVHTIKLNTQSTISEKQAFQLAKQYLNTKDTTFRQGKKLIVSKGFTFTPESFFVAFQFDIDVSLIERWRISIDARNGQLINKVSLVNTCFNEKEVAPPLPNGTGTGLTNYYGSQNIRVEKFENGASRLVGQTENGGSIGTYDFRNVSIWAFIFDHYRVDDFYSANDSFNTLYQKPAVSVQWATEQAFEYYFKKHGRNSYDNNGSPIVSYVHVDQDWENAAWARNKLLFGDGINNNPLVELDVVAHEITHGVTQYEANLEYINESGALNESFSDIFGKAVEFDLFGDTATWQLSKHFRDGGLRDFSNPNRKNQPDTYAGDMWFTGYEDNGGVHYNSGVQNFWYYLLCEGGSGVNDFQVNYTVNAIGMEAATNIAYRNLTEYLSYFSDYLDSRIGSLLATADLYGNNSAIYQEVDKAWDAVGVIFQPIITGLELYDITATTVKIKGSLLPRGENVTFRFEYGTTPSFGSSSSSYTYTDNVEGILTGLQSQTKYYIRLVATNENGSTFSGTQSFTTVSLAPMAKIKQTVDVTETTAILYGEINPNSLPTSFYFEYGPTTSLGFVTPTYPLSDTTEFLRVSSSIADLAPRQTYYYKLVATNGFASATTESNKFFTAVKPIISYFTPVTARIDTEVTLVGQNFNLTRENNIVSFGATRATVLSASSTEIKVNVPAGASFGPISVLDNESGLIAHSVQEFVPTFRGEFRNGSLQLRVGINDISIYQTLVEDMDGDGKPDIVTRHYNGFSIFQNVNQGGDITEESFVRNTYTVNFGSEVHAIDFDGNGLKDIVGAFQDGIRIYPNFSVPGFIFFGVPVDVTTGYMENLIFNDFDLDGHIDIAGTTAISGNSRLTIFRNENPKGYLTANNFAKPFFKPLSYYVYHLSTTDLNNDGLPEVIASAYDEYFSILKNESHPGTFSFEETIVQDTALSRIAGYVSHDLNHDGWRDIIAHSSVEIGNLALFENMGSSPIITLAKAIAGLSGYVESAVQAGDMDGDGKVDMLVGTPQREFILLKNKVEPGEHLSNSSFEKLGEYGMELPLGYGTVQPQLIVNDLNGDGRPEVISAYIYYFGPNDGYQMEIWQNSPDTDCPDPALIKLNVSNYSATIELPPNTTFDQFEIEYAPSGSSYWWRAYSTTLYYLSPGYPYQLRIRSKCYLDFTSYYYVNFTAECVDLNSFYITHIGVNTIFLNSSDINSYEVQFSLAGKDQWVEFDQYSNQITNLLPGTAYDLRYRGRCFTPSEFKYLHFTTLCTTLSSLYITELSYNRAVVGWTSNYFGQAILEYSVDNISWSVLDETQTMFPLTPGTQYFVRGRMACTDTRSDFIYTSFETPCPQVSMLNVNQVSPFNAIINWVDESNTGSYVVMYSITAGGTVTTLESTSTSIALDGLSPGTQYTVTVAPQCVGAKNFTSLTFQTVCYGPVDLLVSDITHTTAELSWNETFSGEPYSVEYTIVDSYVWSTTKTALTTLSLTKLRPGTNYEVRVHITCLSETPPYISSRFKTGLYDETTYAPNPTSGRVTIYPSKNIIGNRFFILDSTGRIVSNGELRDYTFDLSNFSPGLYTLKIDGEKLLKIVKH